MNLFRKASKWLHSRLMLWIAARLGVASLLFARGTIYMEHYRDGVLLQRQRVPNGITDVGMNALLGIMFHGDTQITTWYIGIVNNSGFSAFANADTMGSHAGWTEWTSYDEAARVEWVEDAAAARAISNTTTADFTISAAGTLHGIFVTSDSTKAGTTGTLWSTAAFSSNITVADNDVIKITYTVSG
jgi:hypothetical protein